MKKLPYEDEIKARLRELTMETRKLRVELRGTFGKTTDRTRSLARDLPSLSSRRRKSR